MKINLKLAQSSLDEKSTKDKFLSYNKYLDKYNDFSFNHHSTLAFDHSTLAFAKSRATLARPAGLGRPAGEACVRLPEATEEDLNGFKWR